MRLAPHDRMGILGKVAAFFAVCDGMPGGAVPPAQESIEMGNARTWQEIASAIRSGAYRTPYINIGNYMERFWLLPEIFGERIRVHNIRRSDDDRALHDHPWHFVSVILEGEYIEHLVTPGDGFVQVLRHRAGDMLFRHAEHRHRLEVPEGHETWTLVITTPIRREWGFWPGGKFVPWREYAPAASELPAIGPGAAGDLTPQW